jgi:hypothetical protein
MNPHRIASRLPQFKSTVLVVALFAALVTVGVVGIASSTAQSTQKEERELEDKIPKHLPIKVKVKNLNSEKWARDVEVEVTNTGNKPIYFLLLSLYFVDVKMDNGDEIGFPLRYGRLAMVDVKVRAIPEDIPIQPGETYVFNARKGLAVGWEKFRTKNNKPHPKKVGIRLDMLNFGDGTGLLTSDGLPVSDSKSSKSSCGEQRNKDTFIKAAWNVLQDKPDPSAPNVFHFLPANFLPVNFSPVKTDKGIASNSSPQSGLCCPGTSCFFMKLTLGGNCFCEGEDPATETDNIYDCNDNSGRCGIQLVQQYICDSEGHTCTRYFVGPCPTANPTPSPTPTPIPTPTPRPTPCATPDPQTQPNPSCIPFGPCPPFGTQGWACDACSGPIVHHPAYPDTNGCPDGYYNDGSSNCCVSLTADACIPGTNASGEYCSCPPPNFPCSDLPYTTCPFTVEEGCGQTPVLVDVAGDGFALTSLAGGVAFDIDGNPDQVRERISWTRANSDDAWLALDRDGDGRIESGRELFGNYTWQPRSSERNGFLALAEYDKPSQGGNADGVIDKKDAVFSRLRLWQDANHNGVSEPHELHAPEAFGLAAFELKYRESKRADEYGNQFKYRAKVASARGAQAGRWAWDVFLVAAQ